MSRSALPMMRVKRKPAFNLPRACALVAMCAGFAGILPIAAVLGPLAGVGCFAFMLLNALIVAAI